MNDTASSKMDCIGVNKEHWSKMEYNGVKWILLELKGIYRIEIEYTGGNWSYRIKIKDNLIRWRILEKMKYTGENRVYFSRIKYTGE